MLRFFRQIRQRLLTENRFSKYLLYAIGEIALVVIGILIALQINNWNEGRKYQLQEKEILKELVKNIEFNNKQIEDYIAGKERYNRISDYVIAVLDGTIPYSDSLDNVLNQAFINRDYFFFSKVAYESLKNLGIELIRNDSLKTDIVELFDHEYVVRRNAMNNWTRTAKQQDYIDQHFLPISGDKKLILKPYDFNVQINDPYFRSLIVKAKIQRDFYANTLLGTLEESQMLLRRMKEELNRLE